MTQSDDSCRTAELRKKREEIPPPLRESAERAIDHFLATLDGESCYDLYEMVVNQVEEPLLRVALCYTKGNQSQAAAMLGLNRGTLRKKLRQHGLLTKSTSKIMRSRINNANTSKGN